MQHKIEQYRNFWKTIAPVFIFLWVFGLLLFMIIKSVAPAGKEVGVPEIAFQNVRPCLGFDEDHVEKFTTADTQYICADMETDEAQVFLELHVYESKNMNQVYVTGNTFSSGQIAFSLDSLPSGKYMAWIFWGRTNLVRVDFEVVDITAK